MTASFPPATGDRAAPGRPQPRWTERAGAVTWLAPIAFGATLVGVFVPWFRITGTRHGEQVFTTTVHSWQGGWLAAVGPTLFLGFATCSAVLHSRGEPRTRRGSRWPLKPLQRIRPLVLGGLEQVIFGLLALLEVRQAWPDGPDHGVPARFGASPRAAEQLGVTISHSTAIGCWVCVAAAGATSLAGLVLVVAGHWGAPARTAQVTPGAGPYPGPPSGWHQPRPGHPPPPNTW